MLQDALVVAEFALALPLLAGAALLLLSFLRLQQVDTGVDAANVIAIRVSLPGAQYAEGEQRTQFWNDALREVGSVPGLLAASITSSLPPDNQGDTNNFDLVDNPVAPGAAEPQSPWSGITSDYFETLHVPLRSGRTFNEHDTGDAPPVLIVSQAWADRYFPGSSPLGRQLIEGGCIECPRSTIVGVVDDVKYSGLAGSGDGVYAPYSQWPRSTVHLVVRTAADPYRALAAIRARVHAVDPQLPLDNVQLMEERLGDAIAGPRHWTLLVGGFAAIAALLAALGVFGVMSYVVSQRQREIGVRLALGAEPSSVVALVVRHGLSLAGLGTILGLFAAVQSTRAVEHVLFGVTATDPRALGGVAVGLLAIAALACYVPGRRAAGLDPVRVITAD